MTEWIKKLPLLYKFFIGVVLAVIITWIGWTIVDNVSNKIDVWIDNYKDQQLVKKDKELEAIKEQNKKDIELLKADNIKLKAERDAQDKVIATIKDAIANDGKIVLSEQKKIDEARKKYEDTKDSCVGATDADTYTQCVCSKLGVTCD